MKDGAPGKQAQQAQNGMLSAPEMGGGGGGRKEAEDEDKSFKITRGKAASF